MPDFPDTSSEPEDAIDLREIIGVLLDKIWIPITTTILCIAAGIAYLKVAEPIFMAKATVEVLMTNRNLAGMEVQGMNVASADTLATTEANLQRTFLFQKVMEREEISQHPDLGLAADLNSSERAMEMADWTSVKLRGESRLIDISVKHANAEVAGLLATGIFDEYVAERVSIEQGSTQSAFKKLLVEKGEIDTRLEQLEADQQSIAKALEAKTALLDLKSEIEVLHQTKGPLHPDVKALSTQMNALIDDLEVLVGRALPLLEKNTTIADPPAAGEEALSREKRLFEKVDQLELVQLSLLRAIESERVLSEVIDGRLKEAGINMDIQTIPLALVEPAFASDVPVSPRKINILGFAAIAGGGSGLSIIWILHFLNCSLTTVPAAERATGLPVIGVIPYDKRMAGHDWLEKRSTRDIARFKQASAAGHSDGSKGETPHGQPKAGSKIEPLVLFSDPGSAVAESFRTLRATFSLRAHELNKNTCLVVSAVPDEGKSFVAANFAAAMAARADMRTLLIDADLRCPSMQVIFDIESRGAGLSEALRDGSNDLMSLVVPTGLPNLDILPAGGGASNPAELLSSPILAPLLNEFSKVYDRIVIDAAPVNVVADGLLLAPHVDALLLVVRAGRTPGSAVNHAIQMLSDAGCPPDGIVMNQMKANSRTSSNPYSTRSYTMFQKYGENYS